jgi:hypothetical protein
MSAWESRKKRSWKIQSNDFRKFSKKFYGIVQNEATPFLKDSFMRLVAESGKTSRMNGIEINVSVKGKRLKQVI